MSESLPLVSIVTPSFNQGSFIERTILSVLNQDYPHIEYIVVDALSTDETGSHLSRYDSQIDLIIREKDKGQSDGLNKGFARSSGQIMAYLNADDCLASSTIVSNAVEQFREHNADVVYGRRYRITSDGFFMDCYPFREFDEQCLRRFNIIPQECSFWTREMFEKAGGCFRTDLSFSMDYEMWLRFLQFGARFKSIDTVYGYFRWHENQKSQVIWRDVCLPEVEKIQMTYAGFATTTGDMQQLHESFYYGADLTKFPRQRFIAMRLWDEQLAYSRACLAGTPLDCWVYAS
jgi:glycosyltransferase involved in cell wall biosynthesis